MTREEINILQDIVDIYEKEDMYPLLKDKQISTIKMAIEALEQEPKVRHCEECKHFRKLPHHADKLGRCLGRCMQHTGFCPKSDWYCADYEPRKECNTCKHQLKFMCSEWKECKNYSKYEPQAESEE